MKLPLEVVTRGPVPPGFKEEAREHAARLDHFYADIMRARVTLEHRPRHPGPDRWSIRLALTVPGGTIVVTRQKPATPSEALREGFEAAVRRLEDYVQKRRGFVKAHTRASRGSALPAEA